MTPYQLCKTLIEKGNYEYNSMLTKMDVFLLVDRITLEQYNELKGMMDAQQESA